MIPPHYLCALLLLLAALAPARAGDLLLPVAARLPKKECTLKYIGNGAGCICYLFNEQGEYPDDTGPYCKAAYANPSAQRSKCDAYVVGRTIKQDAVEETLMWSVENCLTTPAVPATRLLAPHRSAPVSAINLPHALAPTERFFFLPALAPLIGKVVLKGALFAGKQLIRRAGTRLLTRRTSSNAAKRAFDGIRRIFVWRRRAAKRTLDAAKRAEKAAKKTSDAAKKRSSGLADKVSRAEKAARDAAKRVVANAKKKARELVDKARRFARKEARAVADCVRERVDEIRTGDDVLVEADAGTVREEVETCLRESKVLCVGLLGVEAARGDADAESLSFFADVATCLSDNEAVCVGALTAKLIDGELGEREYAAELIECFPGSEKCAPQVLKLTVGGDFSVEDVVEQAIACKEEEEEERKKKDEKKKEEDKVAGKNEEKNRDTQ